MTLLQKRITKALSGKFDPISKSQFNELMSDFFTLVEFDYSGDWDNSMLYKAVSCERNVLSQGALQQPWLWGAYSLMRWLHVGKSQLTVSLSEDGAKQIAAMYERIGEQLGLTSRCIAATDKMETTLALEPFLVVSYNALISHSLVMDLSPSSEGAYIRNAELLIPNGTPFLTGELPIISVPVSHTESANEKTVSFAQNVFRFVYSKLKSEEITQDSELFDVDSTNKTVVANQSGIAHIRKLWDELTSNAEPESGLYNLYFKLVISALEAAWLYELNDDYGFKEPSELFWRSHDGMSWVPESEKQEHLCWAVRVKHGFNVERVSSRSVAEVMNAYDLLGASQRFYISVPNIDKKQLADSDLLKKCVLIKPMFGKPKLEYDISYVSGQRVHQSKLNEFIAECKDRGTKASLIVRSDSMKAMFKGLPDFVSVKTHYEFLDDPNLFHGKALVFEFPNSKSSLDAIFSKIKLGAGVSGFETSFCSMDMRFTPDSNEGLALDVAATNYSLSTSARARKKSVKALLSFWLKFEGQLKGKSTQALLLSGSLRSKLRNAINEISYARWDDLNAHEFSINRLVGSDPELAEQAIAKRSELIKSGNSEVAAATLKQELLNLYYKQLTLHHKSREVSYLNSVLSGPDFSAVTQSEKRLMSFLSELRGLLC